MGFHVDYDRKQHNIFILFLIIQYFQKSYSYLQLWKLSSRLHQRYRSDIATSRIDTGYDDWMMRFKNIPSLYPDEDQSLVINRLRAAHICVIGIGGVGSWTAEALARSGIGSFTLVDLDDVCISNINRQLHALVSTVGKMKAEVVRERILDINPYAHVNTTLSFITSNNVDDLIVHNNFTYVVDAVDDVCDKAAIIDACVRHRIPVICSGGGAGLVDPGKLMISDIVAVGGDNLIMQVRKHLRQRLSYPAGDDKRAAKSKHLRKAWNISVVHTSPTGTSRSPSHISSTMTSSSSSLCDMLPSSTRAMSSWRNCDGVLGNACFVTGTMGFMIASKVVTSIATDTVCIPDINKLKRLAGTRIRNYHHDDHHDSNEANHPIISSSSISSSSSSNTSTPSLNSTSHDNNIMNSTRDGDLHIINDLISSSGASMDVSYPLIDSHCHLQLDPLYQHVDDAIHRSMRSHLQHIIACGVCPGDDWQRLSCLYDRYPYMIMPQYGLHPWYITRYRDTMTASSPSDDDHNIDDAINMLRIELQRVLERQLHAGVGECGLDKNIKRQVSLQQQELVLMLHLELASYYRRPVTLHCVNAWGRLLSCLQPSSSLVTPPAMILHSCNSMPVDILPSYHRMNNIYYSFNARQLGAREQQLLRAVPIDRLLIESDSPDQLPSTLIGAGIHHNEPAFLPYTCMEVARVLGLSYEEVASITMNNAQQAFMTSGLRDDI